MNQTPPPSPETSLFQVNLDISNNYILRSAASWARVLGIVGIIMGAFFFFVAFAVYIAYNNANGYETNRFSTIFGGNDRSVLSFALVIYILVGLVFIFGAIFSLNFGGKIFRAIRSNDQNALNSSFAALRNYFAFRSVILIICLLLIVIGVASRL